MKKVIASIVLLMFLFSCGPGAAISRNLEDIDVVVSPPAAGYKVALYSRGGFVGSTLTDAKGTATFLSLPIGSYQATVYDPTGAKVTDKYFSSKYVAGPKNYIVSVKLAGVPPAPQLPAQVCNPNSRVCVDDHNMIICSPDGLSASTAICLPPQPWCHVINSVAYCVHCRSDMDCTAPKDKCVVGVGCVECVKDADCASGKCQNNVCAAPEKVCTPNKFWCDGNVLKNCKFDGTEFKTTACTSPKPYCAQFTDMTAGCVECITNANCASGNCQNNVCVTPTVSPTCVRCPYGRTDCKWIFKNLCTPLGEGGYSRCSAFIFYDTSKTCQSGDNYGIVPTDVRGTVPGTFPAVNIYPQYECMYCSATETVTTKPIAGPVCGNQICETGESYVGCPADCEPPVVCGNKKCEAGETYSNCPADCPAPIVCGNNKCEAGETSSNCPQDCGAPQVTVSSSDTASIVQCYLPGMSGGHLTTLGWAPVSCTGVPLETNLGFLMKNIPSGIPSSDVTEVAYCKHTYGGSGTPLVSTYYENELAFGVPCSPETRPSEYSPSVMRVSVGRAFNKPVANSKLAYVCKKDQPLYNFRISFDENCHADVADTLCTTNIYGAKTCPWQGYKKVGTAGYWLTKSSLP